MYNLSAFVVKKFETYLKNKFGLHKNGCSILIAVSGGIDSVVLADLFYKAGYHFEIAHCNFQLRGEESMRDETFVLSLGEKYKTNVFVKRFDTEQYAAAHKLSIQEAARELRYGWFNEIQSTVDGRQSTVVSVSTAHNADDNIETLLANLFRGTGISGLHGIPAKQNNIMRPLLFASREEIAAYAGENNLQWVEDSSNKEDKYTRNFIRLNILPELTKIFPSVKENILHSIERFGEAEILYRQAVSAHIKKLVVKKGNEFHIPVLLLQKTEPVKTILWEIIKPFGFSSHQADEVMKLFDAANSSYVTSSSHRIIKNRRHFIIAPLRAGESGIIVIEKEDREIIFGTGKLFLSEQDKPAAINTDADTACLDASKIEYPLILRKWKQGDYFYPLGMTKKKKLARFFIDKKLSSTQKENTWVIEMIKKIIWVIGQRIDERFKIIPSTKKMLQIRFMKN